VKGPARQLRDDVPKKRVRDQKGREVKKYRIGMGTDDRGPIEPVQRKLLGSYMRNRSKEKKQKVWEIEKWGGSKKERQTKRTAIVNPSRTARRAGARARSSTAKRRINVTIQRGGETSKKGRYRNNRPVMREGLRKNSLAKKPAEKGDKGEEEKGKRGAQAGTAPNSKRQVKLGERMHHNPGNSGDKEKDPSGAWESTVQKRKRATRVQKSWARGSRKGKATQRRRQSRPSGGVKKYTIKASGKKPKRACQGGEGRAGELEGQAGGDEDKNELSNVTPTNQGSGRRGNWQRRRVSRGQSRRRGAGSLNQSRYVKRVNQKKWRGP